MSLWYRRGGGYIGDIIMGELKKKPTEKRERRNV